jgi:hypothetical protein
MSKSDLLFCRGGIDVVEVALETQKQADHPTKSFVKSGNDIRC